MKNLNMYWQLTLGFILLTSNVASISAITESGYLDLNTEGAYQKTLSESLAQHKNRFTFVETTSSVLLESGSFLYRDLILTHNGLKANSLEYWDYLNSVSDLKRSETPDSSKPIKSSYFLRKRGIEIYKESGLIPVSLAHIQFDYVPEKDIEYLKERVIENDEGLRVSFQNTETSYFVGTTVLAPRVVGKRAKFFLPSDLFLNNTDEKINSIILAVNDTEFPIELNKPVEIFLDNPIGEHNIAYSLSYKVGERTYSSLGKFKQIVSHYDVLDKSESGSQTAATRTSSFMFPCFDMPQHQSSIKYQKKGASINLRIYPSDGTVSTTGIATNGCLRGIDASLKQVAVLVDGFDLAGTNDQITIYQQAGEAIERIRSMGFDVITIDYENGNDYIQRNGLAIRDFLVNRLPNWLSASGDQRVVLVGASMGTQTGRYALKTAELASEDHGVDLFISLDGPYQGANVPISLQAFVQFTASLSAEAANLLEGLDSPAASQMLVKNRYPSTFSPATSWYEPKQEFIDYYAEVSALGLPTNSRNVSYANGSGVGSNIYGPNDPTNLNFSSILNSVFKENLLFKIDFTGRTDHTKYDTSGNLIPIFDLDFRLLDLSYKQKVFISTGEMWDIAPGGITGVPGLLREAWNETGALGTMTGDLDFSSFIPTFSALNISSVTNNYAPSDDANYYNKTPFDSVGFETCNTEHVVPLTDGATAFLIRELTAFLDKKVPAPLVQLEQDPCFETREPLGVEYKVISDPYPGEGTWASDGGTASLTLEPTKGLTGIRMQLTNTNNIILTNPLSANIRVCYQTYFMTPIGTSGTSCQGGWAGKVGVNPKMIGFKAWIEDAPTGCDIEYRALVDGAGWTSWKSDFETAGATSGTTRILSIEALVGGTCM